MTNTRLYRFSISLLLMLAAAFGMMTVAQIAQAIDTDGDGIDDSDELITSGDLLPTSFGTATGLGTVEFEDVAGQIIRAALGFLGIIAVVIILIGGFKWMTASGNEDKVEEARKLIIAGIIGLAIILSAYAIASFVIDELVGATTGEIQ